MKYFNKKNISEVKEDIAKECLNLEFGKECFKGDEMIDINIALDYKRYNNYIVKSDYSLIFIPQIFMNNFKDFEKLLGDLETKYFNKFPNAIINNAVALESGNCSYLNLKLNYKRNRNVKFLKKYTISSHDYLDISTSFNHFIYPIESIFIKSDANTETYIKPNMYINFFGILYDIHYLDLENNSDYTDNLQNLI